MSEPFFDQYAEQYDQILGESISEDADGCAYFAEYKIALSAKLLAGKTIRRILDFGCGAGRSLPYLSLYFPHSELWGYDPSEKSIDIARQRAPAAILFSEWGKASGIEFDFIIAANVFHHIPPEHRHSALSRCRSLLAAGGRMILFEHNPYNPATRWVFERCPFDKDAEMLSLGTALRLAADCGFFPVNSGYSLFFPRPLAFLRPIEPFLKRLPLGAQYYLHMASTPPASPRPGKQN